MIAAARRPQSGFTLVEVMISVALVLILIIGINQAFKMVTDTVGAGQTLSAIVRDNRAVQPVLYGDLRGAVTQNPPAFIIASSRVNAFRNRTDEQSDRDGNPLTIDLDNNNTEGEATVFGEVIAPATYNYRSHRTDRLAFFARDQYRRQTGNDGQFTSDMTGGEAYIWYGHLRLRNNADVAAGGDDVNYIHPGVYTAGVTFATNPNNFHASSFALGRMVMMLRGGDDDPGVGGSQLQDAAGVNQVYIERIATAAGALSPLTWGSPATNGTTAVAGFPVHTSRYDLAHTTITEFYADVLAQSGQPWAIPPVAAATGGGEFWWQRLLYQPGYASAIPVGGRPRDEEYRYAANRFFARPLDAAKAARVAPILANGCAQFIVEFAGDYVTQTNTPGTAGDGAITGGVSDGITDFVVERRTGGALTRRTRWYGMPRDVAAYDPATTPAKDGGADGRIEIGTGPLPGVDVLPVRDIRALATVTPTPPLPAGGQTFERYVDEELPAPTSGDDYLAPGAMLPEARYTCAWGPDVDPTRDPLPQQLRITIVLDEPAGRLAEGQTYEYVIDLP